MDSISRQIIAFQVRNGSKKAGEALMAKLAEEFKKPFFIQTISQLTASHPFPKAQASLERIRKNELH